MDRARVSRPAGRRVWLYVAPLMMLVLVFVLVWAASAPGLTVPTLGSQNQHTIAAGGAYSLAIGADGSLWAWGWNDLGQLGNGTTKGALSPTRIGTGTHWVAVAAGDGHCLALKTDGSLWAWGWNEYGQLGDDTTIDRHSPTRVGTGTDWVAVAAGGRHSLALRSDGSLFAWGSNYYGQLGDGTTEDRWRPTRVGSDTTWVAMDAGYRHTLALRSDGSLWAWGCNDFGQLGIGSQQSRSRPLRVGTASNWVAVDAAFNHSLAIRVSPGLKNGRELWSWGDNQFGQVGESAKAALLNPSRVGTDSDWAAVAGGGGYSLGIKTDGSLWAWGWNNLGQLGDRTTNNRWYPFRIVAVNYWAVITAGYSHSLGLTYQGSLWAWGHNNQGQLGDGTIEDRHEPTRSNMTGVLVPSYATTTTTSPFGPPVASSTTTTMIPGMIDSTTSTVPAKGSTTTTSPVPDGSFSDILADHPYRVAIYYLSDGRIITGFEDGTFRPDNPLTRQQFAKMIVKTLGYPVTGSEVCPFLDVAAQIGTDPFYPSKYVAVCASQGITLGKTATTFAPGDNITRQQLITMVTRAAGLSDPPAGYAPSFTAGQFLTDEHYRNARKAAYAGLLDSLAGLGPAYEFSAFSSRGECAQLLYNLAQR